MRVRLTQLHPYENFKRIVHEMLVYYIGNPREVLLSALIVTQRVYAEHVDEFKALLS